MKIDINLDELWVGDEWGGTVAEVIREELVREVRSQIKKNLKEDPELKKMVKALQHKAALEVVKAIGK